MLNYREQPGLVLQASFVLLHHARYRSGRRWADTNELSTRLLSLPTAPLAPWGCGGEVAGCLVLHEPQEHRVGSAATHPFRGIKACAGGAEMSVSK